MAALSYQRAVLATSETLVLATPDGGGTPVSPVVLAHVADALDLHASIGADERGVAFLVRLPISLSTEARERAAIATVRAALSFAGISGWGLSAVSSPEEAVVPG